MVELMPEAYFNYSGRVVRWVDGDSLIADVDLGFYVSIRAEFRLFGIDTPERGRPGYAEATARVNELAPVGSTIEISSRVLIRQEKWRRWLAEVSNGDVSITHDLLANGLAREYDGS